jgi:DNA-binding GntR family transcriptional regulator
VPVSSLAFRIARDIADSICSGDIAPGSHLSAQRLADRFGVSRSPIREAMQILSGRGLVELRANRGFFASAAPDGGQSRPSLDEDIEAPDAYQQFAEDWLLDRIPEEATEQFLRERYRLTKTQVADMLLRGLREGWVERKQGYGWRFLPVAKTPEAFEQIYRFRMVIEPAAILEPTFRVDRVVLAELKRTQEMMIESGIQKLSAERLLQTGALFHEELIKFSGNPFFHQALTRVNRMRRLLEYRATLNRERLIVQCGEHLEILALLERVEILEASYFMRRHLAGALERKSPVRQTLLPAKAAE